MRYFYVFLAIAGISGLFACKEKPKTETLLSIQSFVGTVTVSTASGNVEAKPGLELKQDQTIKTGDASLADLLYGKSGVIRIRENSSVNIALLMAKGTEQNTTMDIDNGKMFVTVSKLTKGSSFKVKSPTSIAAVRGTTFRVSADKKSSRIDVLAGKIKVNPVKEGKVIEEVEKVLEINNSVTLDEKKVEQIVEQKKEIEVAVLKEEEIKDIKEEVKDLKIPEKVAPETKQEIQEVVLDVKKDEEADKLKAEKEEQERLKQEKQQKLEQQRKIQAEKEKARLEKERLEKERLERERIAREKRETKEKRVKNIPTL